MHIHILGICGSFMGGLAVLAKQAGHHVTGCDANVYPPMSTQLEAQGIALSEGFAATQIDLKPDRFVIGNVVSRGNPLMEEILNHGLPYISGPQWLAENVLQGSWVLAVAGTHGKTTTSAMLAWILEYAGLNPGFLIGGVPENFGVSARSPRTRAAVQAVGGETSFFVIEADEYDTAFFDKRSKFVHYRPRTVVLNNLEYDHADIFADLTAIETQFHHLVRIIPSNGLIVSNGREESLKRVLARGCWTPMENLGVAQGWTIGDVAGSGSFAVLLNGEAQGRVDWNLLGEHNRMNALAALAVARHAGVPIETGIRALAKFKNVKRRMEVRGVVNGITVYDDFAHHPTAIATTIAGLRQKMASGSAAGGARLIAVLEPRSNTMRMGAMKDMLAASLRDADLTFCYTANLGWNAAEVLAPLGVQAAVFDKLDALLQALLALVRPGDQVLIMSNGGFGGIHGKLLAALKARYS